MEIWSHEPQLAVCHALFYRSMFLGGAIIMNTHSAVSPTLGTNLVTLSEQGDASSKALMLLCIEHYITSESCMPCTTDSAHQAQ